MSLLGHQTADGDEFTKWVGRRQTVLGRQRDDQFAMMKSYVVGWHDQSAIRLSRESSDSALYIGSIITNESGNLLHRE
jgi:hypothetical protein